MSAAQPSSEAVRFALLLQSELRKLNPLGIRDRIGIHVGEVVIQRSVGMPHPQEVTGLQVDLCSRVMSLGEADQILMTRAAFENARYAITKESIPGLKRLAWRDYGSYRIEGFLAEVDICEVGEIGSAYLRSPKGDTAAHRRSASSQEAIRNWTELMGRTPPLDVTGTVGKDPTENLKSAILLAHSDGFLATWSMVHNQVRASNFLMPNNVGDSGWRLVGAADFDGDSRPDLLFQHLDGSIALWEMDGLRMKRSSFLSPCNAGAPDWRVVGTRGTDSVGEWRVFLQNSNGDLAIWRMEGLTLKKVEALHPSRLDPGWSVAGISDLNGDGTTELVLQHVDGNLPRGATDALTDHSARRPDPRGSIEAAARQVCQHMINGKDRAGQRGEFCR